MKRIVSLLAIIAVAFTLTACTQSSPDESMAGNRQSETGKSQ